MGSVSLISDIKPTDKRSDDIVSGFTSDPPNMVSSTATPPWISPAGSVRASDGLRLSTPTLWVSQQVKHETGSTVWRELLQEGGQRPARPTGRCSQEGIKVRERVNASTTAV